MAKANAAVSPLNWAAAAKPSKKTDKKPSKAPAKSPAKSPAKPKNKNEKIKKPAPATSASRPAAKANLKALKTASPPSAKSRATRSALPKIPQPIELYYWPTPNGWKISIMLEELGLPYVLKPVNINRGDQFEAAFLAISPNNRMPAIIDPDGPDGAPLPIFESGAILQYLGRKTGKFYPQDERARVAVDEWLFWQVAGLGPMTGQAGHFRHYAPDNVYGKERYTNEVHRLLGVMDRRLATRQYLADAYSIADMACIGWAIAASRIENMIADFPNVAAWIERMRARPAVAKGLEVGKELREQQASDPKAAELARKVLFGQR
ncbi:MAG TPA: glutathione S-transferase N-terminal domain-containing protein [Rhizomicrobium sp.]|nr:glutathione S-transferase N-terminal domain-containing protein [Rhizomicrobium sp.]